MKIGIIGAGNIGTALTRRFRELGYAVSVSNSRGPQSLEQLAHETGARAVSVTEAARAMGASKASKPDSPRVAGSRGNCAAM